eukprot:scaffold58700_cov53-Attheya_sp.AAC.3
MISRGPPGLVGWDREKNRVSLFLELSRVKSYTGLRRKENQYSLACTICHDGSIISNQGTHAVANQATHEVANQATHGGHQNGCCTDGG